MKRVLVVASLAGCASGQSSPAVMDADVGQPANSDAKVYLDAGIIEPQHDAPKPPADASIDAPKPPPDAYVCTVKTMQLLVNPALDTTGGWVQQNIDAAYPIITNTGVLAPHSAPNKAWMGGITGEDIGAASATDVLYQDVVVPADTSSLVVSAQYDVRTSETETTVYDRADVSLLKTDGTPLESVIQLTNTTPTTAWTALSKTFTGNYSGQTVRLRFTSTNDIINATSFYFDTFALTATYCQ